MTDGSKCSDHVPQTRRQNFSWQRALSMSAAALVVAAISACGGSNGVAGTAGGSASASAAVSQAAAADVVSIPVSFAVQNVNRTLDVCPTDGQSYTIKGHLVGPRAALEGNAAKTVTVYMHSVGWGEFYWHDQEFPEFDYATRMAALGHISLTYDQLGYGASGRPPGLLNCYGGEADIVNQMITKLRDGDYATSGSDAPASPPQFQRVALASQGVAALMAQPAAYTFHNIDALVVTSWTDFAAAFSVPILAQFGVFSTACALTGEQSDGTSGPRFYEFFPPKNADFIALNFADADPAVESAATAMRSRASCGEPFSSPQSLVTDSLQLLLRQIQVPVLLVNGAKDAFFTPGLELVKQKSYYSGSDDVTTMLIPDAGQALALERSAPQFRQTMDSWLTQHGF